MKNWIDPLTSGWPKVDGIYLVLANDIVNSWEEELSFKGGEWRMLNGNEFPALIDGWIELPSSK
jgi:hypothetical protein